MTMVEYEFATPEDILTFGTRRGLLCVTTLKNADGSIRRVIGLEDNQIIYLAKVEMSHPCKKTDESTFFRLVHATTTDGIKFVLREETSYFPGDVNPNVIENARKYGSGVTQAVWGSSKEITKNPDLFRRSSI
jgi:hypothetical protein